ncbi:hypothetical protein ACQJBY_073477 [Aegilops geniculata]
MTAAGNLPYLPHPSPAALFNTVLVESTSLDTRNGQWTEEAVGELRDIMLAVRANAHARSIDGARAKLMSVVQHLTLLMSHFMSEGLHMRKLRRMFRMAVGALMVPVEAPNLPPFFHVGNQCMSQAEVSNGIMCSTSKGMSIRVNTVLALLEVLEVRATNAEEVCGRVNDHLDEANTYTDMMVA